MRVGSRSVQAFGATGRFRLKPIGSSGPERTFRAIVCLFTVCVFEGAPIESTAGDRARNALLDARIGVTAGRLNNRGGLTNGTS